MAGSFGSGGASAATLPPLALAGSAGAGARSRRPQRRTQLTEDETHEIRETFDLFDSDKDGLIDHHELKVRGTDVTASGRAWCLKADTGWIETAGVGAAPGGDAGVGL